MTRRAFSVSEQNRVGDAARKAGGYSELIDAQAIEARRAETGTGSVHESAVGEADAPTPNQEQS
ncbi:MAG TPA: hypothetical protein DIW45_01090 [Erythrobacter sp.]|nr:hypothetical protein [Erythrobacter sp.]|tara:strand:+ start:1021 stop:1212 length:192 start_codon:yes stop_codon:yes gene_type:complete